MILKPPLGTQLNYSHPLSQGLVGYWLMNEGSGNQLNDLSLNGNDLAFYNTPQWVTGESGRAIELVQANAD